MPSERRRVRDGEGRRVSVRERRGGRMRDGE